MQNKNKMNGENKTLRSQKQLVDLNETKAVYIYFGAGEESAQSLSIIFNNYSNYSNILLQNR